MVVACWYLALAPRGVVVGIRHAMLLEGVRGLLLTLARSPYCNLVVIYMEATLRIALEPLSTQLFNARARLTIVLVCVAIMIEYLTKISHDD